MNPAEPDAYDVFLSHHTADKPFVKELAAALEGRGLHVWLDTWELRPGFPWQEGLEKGIRASQAVAVCVGASGLGTWQEPEMRAFIARSRREPIPVIPVLVPGCPDSPQLNLFLEAYTGVDLRQGLSEEGLELLLWGITGKRPAGRQERARPGPRPEPPARRLPQALRRWIYAAFCTAAVVLSLLFLHNGGTDPGRIDEPVVQLVPGWGLLENLPDLGDGVSSLPCVLRIHVGDKLYEVRDPRRQTIFVGSEEAATRAARSAAASTWLKDAPAETPEERHALEELSRKKPRIVPTATRLHGGELIKVDFVHGLTTESLGPYPSVSRAPGIHWIFMVSPGPSSPSSALP
ncbi:MAG TPA: toll/interleukin-1 receptor domain-containing protein [Thermoanaerobaculia bacterium]|jgi:hypothetical protein|nr:toll/interleukin-1 receptor domain-containing protein [Thermoanaerobaculia bacterium]